MARTAMLRRLLRSIGRDTQEYMASVIHQGFEEAGSYNGGLYRGVRWAGFKIWYRRKTDGATVQYYGGIRQIKNPRRKVKGKIRSKRKGSKRRFRATDKLMQLTGQLRNTATAKMTFTPTKFTLAPSTEYANKQNSMREFLFFTKEDETVILGFAEKSIKKEVLLMVDNMQKKIGGK